MPTKQKKKNKALFAFEKEKHHEQKSIFALGFFGSLEPQAKYCSQKATKGYINIFKNDEK
jgi:hypothetical protein